MASLFAVTRGEQNACDLMVSPDPLGLTVVNVEILGIDKLISSYFASPQFVRDGKVDDTKIIDGVKTEIFPSDNVVAMQYALLNLATFLDEKFNVDDFSVTGDWGIFSPVEVEKHLAGEHDQRSHGRVGLSHSDYAIGHDGISIGDKLVARLDSEIEHTDAGSVHVFTLFPIGTNDAITIKEPAMFGTKTTRARQSEAARMHAKLFSALDNYEKEKGVDLTHSPKNAIKIPTNTRNVFFYQNPDDPSVSGYEWTQWKIRAEEDNGEDENNALYRWGLGGGDYAGPNYYGSVNAYLREGSTNFYMTSLSSVRGIIAGLDSAIQKFRVPRDITVWRGMRTPSFIEDAPKAEQFSVAGKTFSDKGFVATTTSKQQAINFREESGFVFKINVSKGTHAAPGFHNDNEMLLPRDSKFKVVDAYNDNGVKIVEVDLL